MSSCDSLLNEFSCRFCLSEAKNNGMKISKASLFRVEKRILPASDIFDLLNLSITDTELVPNRICKDCQDTVIAFYSLKKNYLDNQVVLLGKTENEVMETQETENLTSNENKVWPIVKEFMKENGEKCFTISKYTDRLLIDCHEQSEEDESLKNDKIQIVTYNRPAEVEKKTTVECQIVAKPFQSMNRTIEISSNSQEFTKSPQIFLKSPQFLIKSSSLLSKSHQNFSKSAENFTESTENLSKLPENIQEIEEITEIEYDDSHMSCENAEDQVMENEEYLEELIETDVTSNHDETQDTYEDVKDIIKQEPIDNYFPCMYCEKTFSSRSGRDTHQQLKHKCPINFDTVDFSSHEEEIDTNGKVSVIWRCPQCSHVSRKKDHHRTHLIRHAIREKEYTIKQEIETNFEVTEVETDKIVYEDDFAVMKVKSKNCRLLASEDESYFYCSECFSQFPEEGAGAYHIQKFGSTGLCTTCVCTECSVIFPSMKLLLRHQEHHAISGVVHSLNYHECLRCFVVFSNQKDLDAHLKNHVRLSDGSGELYQYYAEFNTKLDGCELQINNLDENWMENGKFRCGHCSKIGKEDEMNLHITFFHAILKCPFDNQVFSRSLGYFVDHLKWKHPDEFKGSKVTFKCPFCVLTFDSLNSMKKHCQNCSEKRFQCNHCNKKFFQLSQLNKHLASISGFKNHKCVTCDKVFSTKSELNIHARTHSDEKPYHCTYPGCNKAFRTNSHRSSHMDTHSNSENYKCSSCDMKFKTRGARRLHEKTHLGEVAPICSICHKEFRQRSHLTRHIQQVHNGCGTQIQKVESSTMDDDSNDSNN